MAMIDSMFTLFSSFLRLREWLGTDNNLAEVLLNAHS